MHFQFTDTIRRIVGEIEKNGEAIWIVGGAVRDTIMNKAPKDIDLATNMDHLTLEVLIKKMGLIVIPDAVAKQHGIIRVIDRDTGEIIDIARLRKDCRTDGRHAIVKFTDILEEDLARRDFTINAMACQVDSIGNVLSLVDPFGGQRDVQENRIKWVGEFATRIREDYLRLVRMCRFTSLWEFCTYELHAYHQYRDGLSRISKERIRDEILKALGYQKPSNFFRNLFACGLLSSIMPQLNKCIGVGQNEYHAETVFEHLMYSVDASVELTDNILLRLAIFFHDIGKATTRSMDKDGRIHFYKHEVASASIAYEWMKEYKFPKKDIDYVVKMVRHHQWRFEDDTKDKTIRKWLQEVGKEHWRDLITLRCADRKGNMAKRNKPMITKKMRELMQRVQNILDQGDPVFKEDLAINGHDIEALGIKPGKIYKEIFSNIMGIVVTDPERNTKEWLLNYVSKNYVKESNHV